MIRAGAAYRFPWTLKARAAAVKMATAHERVGGRPVAYRTIALELRARGLVTRLPDAATVRRMVMCAIGRAR